MNEIYTTQTCPWCQRAKVALDKHGIEYREIDVTTDRSLQIEIGQRAVDAGRLLWRDRLRGGLFAVGAAAALEQAGQDFLSWPA